MTQLDYVEFYREMREAPCTREAIDAIHMRYFGPSQSSRYPDEWYADKDNRMEGKDTGHLRCLTTRGGKMVWIPHGATNEEVAEIERRAFLP